MADNVLITAGTDTTIATDEIGGVHYQEVKLVSGTKGAVFPVKVDEHTGGIATMDWAHHEVHEGDAFSCHYNNDVTNVGEMTIIAFNTPNTTKWIHLVTQVTSTAASYFAIYEAADLDLDEGTDLTIYNRDRNSATAATVTSIETAPEAGKATSFTEVQAAGATLATTGEIHREYMGSGSGQTASGGESRGTHEWILDQGVQYAFVMVGTTTDDCTHNIVLTWYEHTNL